LSSTDTPADTDTPPEVDAEAVETDEAREALLAQIGDEFGEALVGSHLSPGDDLWVRVTSGAWRDLAEYLRTGLGFAWFNFLSGIDWLPSPYGRDMDSQVDKILEPPDPKESEPMETGVAGGDTRFQVFARVHDVVNHRAVTAKVDVPDDLTVYPGANWHERECWEMYGIGFQGHPDVRHLYLPGAFEGHPLRKDYPLLARRMKPWPGIVDVELMPGEEDEPEAEEGDS
jgi:NADH-quinone oxidoreductase subunit C